jgi:hypothetical protein
MVSGSKPQIQVNGYTIHHNGYDPGSWDIEATNHYYFSVEKKEDWAPNTPVPLMADAYISMYVMGQRYQSGDTQHGATAYARVRMVGTSSLTFVEAAGDWTNPYPQPHEIVAFTLMPETATKAELYVHASCVYGLESGHEDVQVIADPTIYVDWTAQVNVDGTDYYATELYEVVFSEGFTGDVPEPSSLGIALIGILVLPVFRRRG